MDKKAVGKSPNDRRQRSGLITGEKMGERGEMREEERLGILLTQQCCYP